VVNHTTRPDTLFNGEALYFLAVTLSCIIASHLLFGELHVIPSTPGVDFPGLEVTFFTASALAEKSCIAGWQSHPGQSILVGSYSLQIILLMRPCYPILQFTNPFFAFYSVY
jgi:hypothetical protein